MKHIAAMGLTTLAAFAALAGCSASSGPTYTVTQTSLPDHPNAYRVACGGVFGKYDTRVCHVAQRLTLTARCRAGTEEPMSVKVMNAVFERYPEGGGEMILALALADHSHDDGTHIYPSVDKLAAKTRQSPRAVQYQLRRMQQSGWLILVSESKGGRGNTREYRINSDWINGAELAPISSGSKGAKNAPNGKGANDDVKGATGDIKGANHSTKGCKAFAPESSGTVIEPSENHQPARRAPRVALHGELRSIELPDWLPVDAHVRTGDTLAVARTGEAVRVRSIHAQNRATDVGHAGERCALNLAGIDKAALARGDAIVDPRLVALSLRIDVELTLTADADVTIAHWTPLHVHLGTLHRVAHVALLEGDTLGPGRCARAQLNFAEPVFAVPGERFIVRNAQATRTVGGGRVLDPFGPARKRRTSARRAWLDALASWLDEGRLDALLDEAPLGITRATLMHLTGLSADAWALPADAVNVAGPGRHADEARVLARGHWDALRARGSRSANVFGWLFTTDGLIANEK